MTEEVTLRLRIGDAEFEAKGSEDFANSTWEKFVAKVEELSGLLGKQPSDDAALKRPAKKKSTKTAVKSGKKVPSYQRNNEFANGEDGAAFISEWDKIVSKPTSAMKKNIVFIHLLTDVIGHRQVDINLIYTCYRMLKFTVPQDLNQSIRDSNRQHTAIDFTDWDNLKLTVNGENMAQDLMNAT